MAAPDKVLQLVKLFEDNSDDYHAEAFKEAETRQQFINSLFKCLGWDMENESGAAEKYKDVVHEAAIKIGTATKARITSSAMAKPANSTWKRRSRRCG
ncbi:MAG TPA: hypothetical protein VKS79_01085 [Gemmataceae bacterium]|nr:hypothetical protein [Gemmataceae bacterium]